MIRGSCSMSGLNMLRFLRVLLRLLEPPTKRMLRRSLVLFGGGAFFSSTGNAEGESPMGSVINVALPFSCFLSAAFSSLVRFLLSFFSFRDSLVSFVLPFLMELEEADLGAVTWGCGGGLIRLTASGCWGEGSVGDLVF